MRNRSGMALVLALMAVSLLVAITVQLFTSVKWQINAAANFSDSVNLDTLNRSALSIARSALLADQDVNQYDSPHDEWNFLGEKDLHTLLGSDSLEIKITDLSGKLQINALVSNEKDRKKREKQENAQYTLWLRFLSSGRFALQDEQEAIALLDAIKDWIDSDDEERDYGAESGYYLSLEKPYKPRNAPVQSLEELLLVRGMTKDIFYGNEEYSGIFDYLTSYGSDGKININSAPPHVLQIMAEGLDEEMVLGLVEFRKDDNNKDYLSNPEWYQQVNDIPGYITIDKEIITVRSYFFQIESTVNKNQLSRSGRAIIYRDEKGAQNLLRWDVE